MRQPASGLATQRLALSAPHIPQLYIGNLASGNVPADALRQVFDSALMAAFPEVRGAAQSCNCTASGVGVGAIGRVALS
jgi:hypothetical protein